MIPAPATFIFPFSTVKPLRVPSVLILGLPVVRTARSTLIKPAPLTLIPLGLAMIRFALLPAISIKPLRLVAAVPVTSCRMVLAALPARLILTLTLPAIAVSTGAFPALLLNTRPSLPTLKEPALLWDKPAALGAAISTTGADALGPAKAV